MVGYSLVVHGLKDTRGNPKLIHEGYFCKQMFRSGATALKALAQNDLIVINGENCIIIGVIF